LDYVDRVVVMHKGEVKADGTLAEVKSSIDWLD
jgi:energy-coupling factor transporter ATP-binding protein EcfA2